MTPMHLELDERGAVFVEKLIVYLPLMLTFFLTWELAELGAASLIVQRACSAAGRAAMVVLPDDPVFYDGEEKDAYTGRRRDDIELAAGMILSANPKLSSAFEVSVSDPPKGPGAIDVSLSATYECGAVSLICGTDSEIELTASSSHAYHGADYEYGQPGGGVGEVSPALSSADGAAYRGGSRPGSSAGASSKSKYPGKQQDLERDCNSCREVHAGICMDPQTAFGSGIWSQGVRNNLPLDLDLIDHIRLSNSSSTGFVSTSKSKQVASNFAAGCPPAQQWTYTMRVCGGIEVPYDELYYAALCWDEETLDKLDLEPDYFAQIKNEQEVAVIGGFEGADIVSASPGLANPVKTSMQNPAFENSDGERKSSCSKSKAKGQLPKPVPARS